MTLAGLSDVVAAAVAEVVRRDATPPLPPLPEVALEPCRVPGQGDFSTAVALRLAPLVDVPAARLAARLADLLAGDPAVQAARVSGPGFVNVSLRARPAAEVLTAALEATPPSASSAQPLRGVDGGDAVALQDLRRAAVSDTVSRLRESAGPTAPRGRAVEQVGEVVVRGETEAAVVADVDPAVLRFELLRHPVAAPLGLDTTVLTCDAVVNPGYAVRYAAARCSGVLRSAVALGVPVDIGTARAGTPSSEPLEAPAAVRLVGLVSSYSEVVRTAADRSEPHRLARHLERTADAVLALVEGGQVLPRGDEESGDGHRALVLAVRAGEAVLRNGLMLLGIPAPVRL